MISELIEEMYVSLLTVDISRFCYGDCWFVLEEERWKVLYQFRQVMWQSHVGF